MRRFRTLPTTAVVTTRAGSTRRSSPPPHLENATARQAPPDAGSEFTPLLRDVKGQGLLDRRPGWYARTIATNALGLAAIVTGMALGGSWWVVAPASVLAVLCARTAFIGHDAGHAQISGNRATNRRIGLIHGNLLLGMSYASRPATSGAASSPTGSSGASTTGSSTTCSPSMPRPHLSLAQSMVKARRRDLGIPYAETDLVVLPPSGAAGHVRSGGTAACRHMRSRRLAPLRTPSRRT